MSKFIATALQVEADICNALETPVRGCRAGAGLHVDIPADWLTRVLAGQQVPGCSYYVLASDMSLVVSDVIAAKLLVVAEVNKLPVRLKDAAPALITKLATAPTKDDIPTAPKDPAPTVPKTGDVVTK